MPTPTATDTNKPDAPLPPCWVVAVPPDNGEGFQLSPEDALRSAGPDIASGASQTVRLTPLHEVMVMSIVVPKDWGPFMTRPDGTPLECVEDIANEGHAYRWQLCSPIVVGPTSPLTAFAFRLQNNTGKPQRPRHVILLEQPENVPAGATDHKVAIRESLTHANKHVQDACNRARLAGNHALADECFHAGRVVAALLAMNERG